MANPQEDIAAATNPDLLAAVVLHLLVTEGRDGVSTEQVARMSERDPADEAERQEVETALEILVRDDLAVRETDAPGSQRPQAGASEGPRFRPTRAAVRASELSF